VPRFQGHVLGKSRVLLLLAISTLVMAAAFLLVLYMRESGHQATLRQISRNTPDQIADALRAIDLHSSSISFRNRDHLPEACLLAALSVCFPPLPRQTFSPS
jgi:hypothetical protein